MSEDYCDYICMHFEKPIKESVCEHDWQPHVTVDRIYYGEGHYGGYYDSARTDIACSKCGKIAIGIRHTKGD